MMVAVDLVEFLRARLDEADLLEKIEGVSELLDLSLPAHEGLNDLIHDHSEGRECDKQREERR